MAQILVRRLDDAVVERLRARAKRHKRSLEEEVRVSLAEVVRQDGLLSAVAEWRAQWPEEEHDEDAFADVRQRGPGRVVDLD